MSRLPKVPTVMLRDLTVILVIMAGVLAAADIALALDPAGRAAALAGLRMFFGLG